MGPMRTTTHTVACALAASLAFALAPGASLNTQVPKLRGETLDDQKIVLPDAAAGRILFLALGFSKKAGNATGPWRDHFAADFGADPHAAFYVAAMLESAPSLFRGMIRSAMRGGTAQPMRSHVLTCTTDNAVWKKYVDLTDDSLPVVLLTAGNGRLLWTWTGAFDPVHYQSLKTAAATALR